MHQLVVQVSFSGAHYLNGYEGPCARMHGHNFKVEVRVSGNRLDNVGMLIDFKEIKNLLKGILENFDHRVINEVPPFDTINPTAENLTRYIYDQLAPQISSKGATLDSVAIWETEKYGAIYTPES